MNPANLMGLINESLSRRDVEIGKIEMMNTFAFFELDSDYADKLASALKGTDYAGKKIDLTVAKSSGPNDRRDRSEGPARKDRFKDKFAKNRGAGGSRHAGGGDKKRAGKRPRRPF